MGEEFYIFWAALFSPWIASLAYVDPPRGNGEIYWLVFMLHGGGAACVSFLFYGYSRDRLAKLSERRDEG